MACGRPDYDAAKPAILSRPEAPRTTSTAPPPSAAPSSEPAPPLAPSPLVFEEVGSELARACDPKGLPPESAAIKDARKEALDRAQKCRRAAMTTELDGYLAPLKQSDEKRYHAYMAHQAEWNRYVDAACWINEESYWSNLDAGTRDDGAHRGLPTLTCKNGVYTERFFFARARAKDDAASLATWIVGSQARGLIAKKNAAKLLTQVSVLLARESADAGDGDAAAPDAGSLDSGARRLEHAETNRLAYRIKDIQYFPTTLAKQTCDAWPELASELGGVAPCLEKMAVYYFAYVPYGKTY